MAGISDARLFQQLFEDSLKYLLLSLVCEALILSEVMMETLLGRRQTTGCMASSCWLFTCRFQLVAIFVLVFRSDTCACGSVGKC